jgi:hypothetical protein
MDVEDFVGRVETMLVAELEGPPRGTHPPR